jgi:hypothetical protein
MVGLQHLFYNHVQLREIVSRFRRGITVCAVSAPCSPARALNLHVHLPLEDVQHQSQALFMPLQCFEHSSHLRLLPRCPSDALPHELRTRFCIRIGDALHLAEVLVQSRTDQNTAAQRRNKLLQRYHCEPGLARLLFGAGDQKLYLAADDIHFSHFCHEATDRFGRILCTLAEGVEVVQRGYDLAGKPDEAGDGSGDG